MFTVVFYCQVKPVTSDHSEKTIQGILKNSSITTAELAIEVGITEKGIEYHLRRLKADKVIKRVGPDKGGKWVIIKE